MEKWTDPDQDDDVVDESGDEYVESTIYDISSYGADYPVEMISWRIQSGEWYVPPFQRNYVWSLNQASRFIESLLLGLPVPGIFLFREAETQKHLIIDGQQRTKTLSAYLNEEEFGRTKFRLRKVQEKFEGKSFSELDEEDQLRLKESLVHAIIFKQDKPSENQRSVIEVFERLNTGGSKLSAQEIRGCVNHGNFVDFLEELTDIASWQLVFRSKSRRLKDHEMILRFFAFWERGDKYQRPMKSFLDDYMSFRKDIGGPKKEELTELFSSTMDMIAEKLGEKAFRPDRAFNAAVFDCVSVTTARLMRSGQLANNYAEAYAKLMADKDFLELTSRSTADEERVGKRFEAANAYLRG